MQTRADVDVNVSLGVYVVLDVSIDIASTLLSLV